MKEEIEIEKHPVILSKYNVDDNGHPISIEKIGWQNINTYTNTIETDVIDRYFGFKILNQNMTAVVTPDLIKNETQYYVDFENGRIHFHPNVANKKINYKYGAKGHNFISASSVYTKVDIYGNILETLENILEYANIEELRKLLAEFKETIEISNTLIEEIEGTGNKAIYVNINDWVEKNGVYEIPLRHNLNSENLHVTGQDSDKDGFALDHTIVDEDNIVAKCDKPFSGKVILSSMYFNATQTIDTKILEDATINVFDRVVNELGGETWEEIFNKSLDKVVEMMEAGLPDSHVVVRKDELLIMDSPIIEDAVNIIKGTKKGLEYSNDGYNGTYKPLIGINGTINANPIKDGILESANGATWINMKDGTFNFANKIKIVNGKVVIDGILNSTEVGDMIDTAVGDVIIKVDVMYAESDSNTTAPIIGWKTDAPTYNPIKYIWSRTDTTYRRNSGSTYIVSSNPTCISGANGSIGENGVGIDSMVEYYYLSSSPTELLDGLWSVNAPTWEPTKYIWTKTLITYSNGTEVTTTPICCTGKHGIDGIDGLDGLQGEKGEQGIDGVDGADGVSTYFHIKYSAIPNPITSDQMTETPNEYMGTYVDEILLDSDNPAMYNWFKMQGTDGIPGTNGTDGKTTYLHIKYSNDGKTFTPNNGEDTGSWIGQYVDFTEADSLVFSKYKWSKIKGEDGIDGLDGLQGEKGEQGIPGTNGTDGKTTYFHIKYSSVSNPTSSSQMSETPSTYIGTYVDHTETDSTSPSKYTWSKFEGIDGVDGTDGIPGKNGIDGKTSYLHIKYSNDGETFTSNSGEDVGTWIGQYTDFIQTDSTTFSKYKWSKIKGEDGVDGSNGTDGSDGVGISNVVAEYYLSTSKTTQVGGVWKTSPPKWVEEHYLWTRYRIYYTNNENITTTPFCDSSWEAADEVDKKVESISKEFSDFKIEQGEITSKVDKIEADVTTLGGNITNIESRVTEAEEKITSEAITNTVKESFYTKTDIDSKGYALQSTVEQTVNELEIKFESSGGYNLLKNTSFEKGLDFWHEASYQDDGTNKQVTITTASDWVLDNKNALTIAVTNMTKGSYRADSDPIKVKPYTDYTLSYLVASHGATSIGHYIRKEGFSLMQNYTVEDVKEGGKNPDDWTRVSRTFNTGDQSVIHVNLVVKIAGDDSYTWFIDPMLTEGTALCAWSPHPDEIYAGITTIDEHGIEVRHSDVNSSTRMKADGFYILDEEGETMASLSNKESWTELKADKVFANNIERIYEGDANLYVNYAFTGESLGTKDNPLKSLNELGEFFEVKGNIVNKRVNINIFTTDMANDKFELRNVKGSGDLVFTFQQSRTYKVIFGLYNVTVPVMIYGGNENTTSANKAAMVGYGGNTNTFYFEDCGRVVLKYFNSDGKNSHSFANYQNTSGAVYNSEIVGYERGIQGQYGSRVYVKDCKGNDLDYSLVAHTASLVGSYGTIPNADTNEGYGGIIKTHSMTKANSTFSPPAIPPTSNYNKSFTSTGFATYQYAWGTWAIGICKQGTYSTYGNKAGHVFFDIGEIRDFLGGTILEGNTITVTRANSAGSSGATKIYINGSNKSSASGTPSYTTYTYLGTLKWGETKTFTLPKTIVYDMNRGVVSSLAFYSGTDTSKYVQIVKCSINVKCKK